MTKQIDENLKRVYEKALDEELPTKFTELLAQLKAQDRKTPSDGS